MMVGVRVIFNYIFCKIVCVRVIVFIFVVFGRERFRGGVGVVLFVF